MAIWFDRHRLLLFGFKQMQILPDPSNSNGITILQVENCGNLVEIQGKLPQSLVEWKIESCESLQKLTDLSTLKGLRKVVIRCCGKLDVEEISQLCSEKSVEFVGEDDYNCTFNCNSYDNAPSCPNPKQIEERCAS